jgi:glyceraldehyde-3-phosphate dehydrogenase (NADP+)
MNEIFEIYAAGNFTQTSTELEVINPFTGNRIAKTWLADDALLNHCIVKAEEVSEELAEMPVYKRYAALISIRDGLLALRESFARIITLESGKPYKYALGEVDRSIQTFGIAAEESRRLPGEMLSLDWTPAGKGKQGLVKYFPAGIVAGISPFNFPLNLAVHKLAPAIATGCPILLKPSGLTPLSTLMLARLIHDCGLPEGAVSVLPMDRKTGNRLVTDQRISLLSFTGSPEVGWNMKNQAGNKKVVLELGGNAGLIVASDYDLEAIADKCVTAAFSYSGQVCIHTQRIYVMHDIFDRFTTAFIERTKRLKTGDPLSADTDVAGMIDQKNAERVMQWIDEAVQKGAKVLTGGHASGTFVEPTVLTQTHEEMKVCSNEIFGPVVAIEPVTTFAEAVERINAGRYGLQAGVFTDSIAEINFAFKKLKVGGVIINDVPTFRVDHMPYGGVKHSGFGREGVKYAMLDMLEPKLMVTDV